MTKLKSVPQKKAKLTIKGEAERLEKRIEALRVDLTTKYSRKSIVNLTLIFLMVETAVSYLI